MKTKEERREAVYHAIECLNLEIEQRLEAVRALELIHFGRVSTGEVELIPKPAPAAKKEPRRSPQPSRKKAAKAPAWPEPKKGKRKPSQTTSAKLARAYRAKKKAEAAAAAGSPAPIPATIGAPQPAGKATGAHEALKAKSEAETDKEAAALDRPGNALIDRKARKERAEAARTEPQPAADPQPAAARPTTPPSGNGTLRGLTQRDAIKAVLRNATTLLDSSQLLVRLLNGGFQFKSDNPKAALSVALATYRGELTTETRAGRVFYHPIEGGKE